MIAYRVQSSENKQKYMKLKDQNEHMLKQLEMSQQNIDQLNVKRNTLEEVRINLYFIFTHSL